MPHADYITDTLHTSYQRCQHPARQRRTMARWQHYPALAGKTIRQITAVITDGYHPDHNHVAAALIDAHHHRRHDSDDDAIIVLLDAARPLVLSLDPHDVHGDSRATLWDAVGWRLHAITTDEIITNPTPFLVMLYGRIRTPHLQRQLRRRPPTTLPNERTTTGDHADHLDDIADQVIARAHLDLLQQHPAWDTLARYLRTGTHSGIHPQWVARTRRQLATTIGYAA